MNDYFNFYLPDFQSNYGEDWDDFKTIVDDNVDYVMNKTYQLYWMNDITRTNIRAIELTMRALGIKIDPMDTLRTRKYNVRKFNASFRDKALDTLYLDYAEALVGTRGNIYSGYTLGTFVWNTSIWPVAGEPDETNFIWATEVSRFQIYIDVKTTDDTLLDEIVVMYRQDHLLPAFYQIYLVDSSFNILRTV